jgi:hypothetical protein
VVRVGTEIPHLLLHLKETTVEALAEVPVVVEAVAQVQLEEAVPLQVVAEVVERVVLLLYRVYQ